MVDTAQLVLCPRCGCRTVHLDGMTDLKGRLVDILIWCENCDEDHPLEQAEW